MNFSLTKIIKPHIIKNIFTIIVFVLFLQKASLNFGGEGISSNYSFILFPIFILFSKKKINKPKSTISLLFYLLVCIFIIASALQLSYFDLFWRRVMSFLIFISIFSYVFIKFDEELINNFKLSIIVYSFIYSVNSIYQYVELGSSSIGFDAKNLIGTNRIGFVLVLGFWITLLYSNIKIYVKYFLLFLIFIGILLTFSRSSIITLLFTSLLYLILSFQYVIRNLTFTLIIKLILFTSSIYLLYLLVSQIFPTLIYFFDERLFTYFKSGGFDRLQLDDQSGSEGYRVYLIERVFDYILSSPFYGSGFLGIWILGPEFGSFHNQYTDILFRIGIIGFISFSYLLYQILIFFLKFDLALFIGFSGILFYGFFNETFKESQGAFIFAFFIGVYSFGKRIQKS